MYKMEEITENSLISTRNMAKCDIKFTVINHIPGEHIYISNVGSRHSSETIIISLDGKLIEFSLDSSSRVIKFILESTGFWDINPHNYMKTRRYIVLLVKPGTQITAELIKGPSWILVRSGLRATSNFPEWSAPRIKSMPDLLPDYSEKGIAGCLQTADFKYIGIVHPPHEIQVTNINPKFLTLCSITKSPKPKPTSTTPKPTPKPPLPWWVHCALITLMFCAPILIVLGLLILILLIQ